MSRVPTRLAVGLAISAALVALLARGLDPSSLGAALGRADLRLVPAAVGLYFLGVWVRGARWGLLLPPGAAPPLVLFRALVVGFTVNNLLPVRMGEVARAYLLRRWCGVGYGTTVASLVAERVLDGLALSALLLAAMLFVPPPGYLLAGGLAVAGLFCAGAAALALATWRASSLASLGGWLAGRLPGRLGGGVARLAVEFARGLAPVHGPGRLARVAALSLVGWLLELGVFYVLLVAFALPGSLPLALLAGAAANFATLVPSSPGYVGTFDGALVKVLQDTANVARAPATAYALVVHAALLVPVTAAGGVVLWRTRVSLGQLAGKPGGRAEGRGPETGGAECRVPATE